VLKWSAGVAVVLLTAAACSSGGGGKQQAVPSASAKPGGTYRTADEEFFQTGGMDPSGEYSTSGSELFGEVLGRTLITYKHQAGVAGEAIVPDIATDMGQVSPDGLTWTFHLKRGIKF